MLFRYLKRGGEADPEQARELAEALGVMPATAAILIGRGIATPEDGRKFFRAGLESLRDPFGLAGMAEAAGRVRRAVERGERIAVYGDYDVDGVCAASILTGYLRRLGARCDYYIPSRHTEGYGLNLRAMESLAGADLLITVDCGISNAAEVARARELHMDVIVTDHHECPDALPECTAVVNPKRPGQVYGFTGLCGAGVALKLVHALGGVEEAAKALDLAALATVADIVPLTDENLAVVRLGIDAINEGGRPGIRALKEAAGLEGRAVRSGNIAFALAPRINAGGRMDLSRKSVEMMLTDDLTCAREIARELNDDNAERMKVEEGMLAEAADMVERDYSFSKRRAIVLYRPHWNTGVTGIVASRLVERYGRPAVLFGSGEGACYGSGRSVPGVHLYHALKACSAYFIRFGGHEQAAGCALAEENVAPFADALDKYLLRTYGDEVFLPARYYDAELPLGELSLGLARDVERLEPSGFGNPRPVFLLRDAGISALSRTADGKHLRMRLGGRDGVEGIAFRQGGMLEALDGAEACDALVVPDVNEWMGRERVQAVVEHIRIPQGIAHARSAARGPGADWARALARAADCEAPDEIPSPVRFGKGLAMLAESVRRSCWGTLALCFTQWSAEEVLKALDEEGCLERVYACAGLPRQAARTENALVFAPDVGSLSALRYDTVFVFDGRIACGCAVRIASALNNRENCIIIDEDYQNTEPGGFSREALLRAYRAMKAALAGRAGPRSRGDWAWLAEAHGISERQAELAAGIFIELGLFEELGGPPWLRPVGLNGRTELGRSAIFRRLSVNGGVADESEGQGARGAGLPDAGHTLPRHHDALKGRGSVRGAAGPDARAPEG